MLNDYAWRKTPTDILTNPRIRSIALRKAPELRQAVFAFYMACYMQASEDGVVDVSDTEVYADLLMLDDENIITDFTLNFIKKGFFEPLNEEQTLLFIVDFDNPAMAETKSGHRVPESMESRRRRVNDTISKPKKPRYKKPVQDTRTYDTHDVPPEVEEANLPEEAFSCPLNDKNEECVATDDVLRDKFAENVATHIERDEKKTIAREERHTHTQEAPAQKEKDQAETPSAPLQEETLMEIMEPEEEKPSQEEESSAGETAQVQSPVLGGTEAQEEESSAMKSNIPKGVASRMIGVTSLAEWRAADILYVFFTARSPIPVDSDVQVDALTLITVRIGQLSEPKNEPYVIAGQLTRLFVDLVNGQGAFKGITYFSGMPLTPAMMVKDSVWPRLLTAAKKMLSPGKTAGAFWEKEIERYRQEAEKDRKYNGSKSLVGESTQGRSSPGDYVDFCVKAAMATKDTG